MVNVIKTKIPTLVTTVSCVGICSEDYPLSYGNYFSMPCKHVDSFLGTSVCNFNYENFKEAIKRFLPDNQVEVTMFENERGYKFIAITDERIPQDWYRMWSADQGYCNGGIHGEKWQEVVDYLTERFTNLKEGV